jgi:three-Cys-motif partner protein
MLRSRDARGDVVAVEHRFGGLQTDIKLDVLRRYLAFFTTALHKKGFELWYVDGFAGTGDRLVSRAVEHDALWHGGPMVKHTRVPGSARLALATEPKFDRLVFIERHGRRYRQLRELCATRPERARIDVRRGDANQLIQDLCTSTTWRGRGAPGNGIRGVLFLDPYGMGVHFRTLEAVARTEAIDVWYLFSLSGLYRQAARSKAKVIEVPKKRAAITTMLGNDEWEHRFYEGHGTVDLFGDLLAGYRTADVNAIEGYVQARLETLFPTVLAPLRLYNDRNAPLFSLFFAMSNPDPQAIGLGTKGANHILKSGISSQVRPR